MKSPWPTKKLGEICKIRTGKKDVDEGNPEGKYPFFTCSREITYSDTYSFDTEAILIAGNGDVGNTKIYKGKFEAYQRTYVLDGFQENIKYIYYYLIGNLKRILVKSKSGSTMPYIRKGDLENFKIPLPSLHVQQKIVKILDAIQSAVEIQEKIIEKTKELKKSLMAELFKYGAPSFRNPEPEQARYGARGRNLKKTETLNQSELGTGQVGEIPEDWEVVRLEDVVKLSNGIRPEFDEEGIFPVYGANGIMGKSKKFLVDSEYTLIIGRVGASGEIHLANGKIWISDNALYSSEVEKEKVYLPFLKDYLIWRDLKQFAERSTHPIITQTFLKNFTIPLPSLLEQQEIAEILQTIDQKIEIEKKKKELYEELFRTMLNKIMSQEINVEKIEV
jgi:type I restriction enzyme, S subunit